MIRHGKYQIKGIEMVNDNIPEIQIEPAFQRLVQPLGKASLQTLREQLLQDSSSRVIQTWNGVFLGDQEKYKLCQSMNLQIQIEDKSFLSYNHAASYICSVQLSRTDLTSEYRKYLIGELYLFEEQKLVTESSDRRYAKYRTAYKIGERINLSGGTVLKYSCYAAAINTIFEQSPEFAFQILLGKTRVSHENVIELSRLAPEEIKSVARSTIEENVPHLTFTDIRHEVKYAYTQSKAPVSRRERREQKEKNNARIRQMPTFDPDSDVNSLCMTIRSWVSSIDRVNAKTDFSAISNRAMLDLMKQLTILEHATHSIQKSLVERTVK